MDADFVALGYDAGSGVSLQTRPTGNFQVVLVAGDLGAVEEIPKAVYTVINGVECFAVGNGERDVEEECYLNIDISDGTIEFVCGVDGKVINKKEFERSKVFRYQIWNTMKLYLDTILRKIFT